MLTRSSRLEADSTRPVRTAISSIEHPGDRKAVLEDEAKRATTVPRRSDVTEPAGSILLATA